MMMNNNFFCNYTDLLLHLLIRLYLESGWKKLIHIRTMRTSTQLQSKESYRCYHEHQSVFVTVWLYGHLPYVYIFFTYLIFHIVAMPVHTVYVHLTAHSHQIPVHLITRHHGQAIQVSIHISINGCTCTQKEHTLTHWKENSSHFSSCLHN